MADFNCNYNELAHILYVYEVIVSARPLLDSIHSEISRDAAKIMYPMLMDFEVKVPEEVRKNLPRQTDLLKKKCLEIMSA